MLCTQKKKKEFFLWCFWNRECSDVNWGVLGAIKPIFFPFISCTDMPGFFSHTCTPFLNSILKLLSQLILPWDLNHILLLQTQSKGNKSNCAKHTLSFCCPKITAPPPAIPVAKFFVTKQNNFDPCTDAIDCKPTLRTLARFIGDDAKTDPLQ